MDIHYTIVDSPLGRLFVGATERGVSAVYMGDTDSPLVAALKSDYPYARLHADACHAGGWAACLLNYLGGRNQALDLPLDVEATPFQRRVWRELQAIPYGSTRTYGELARALGYPLTAARAVGRACATNTVSLVIPCHRAVREDGGLGGYRWGLDRKRALLEREGAARPLFSLAGSL